MNDFPPPARDLNFAIDPLQDHLEQTLEQCQRFEEISEILATMVDEYDTTHMAIWLTQDNISEEEIELVLAALALKASPQAETILDAYESEGGSEAHRIFHQIAQIECGRRRQTGSPFCLSTL